MKNDFGVEVSIAKVKSFVQKKKQNLDNLWPSQKGFAFTFPTVYFYANDFSPYILYKEQA